MKKEDIRFQIDQLRKDKMIYAIESIAVTFIFELFYVLFSVVTGSYSKFIALLCILVPLSFFIYAMIGNMARLKKLRQLEKQL
jgi:hypothetical protein